MTTLFCGMFLFSHAQNEALYLFVEDGNEYRDNLKFGFKNAEGKIVVPFIYDYIPKSHDLSDMEFYSNPSYIFLGQFNEGMARVYKKDKGYGFINSKGKEVIPCQYDHALAFTEGLAAVKNKEGKYGYINFVGELVIPYKYTWPQQFCEGVAFVSENDEDFYYINKEGKRLHNTPSSFGTHWADFKNGRGSVCIKDKVGYIDALGNLVIPCIYDHGTEFFPNGLAEVSKDGKTFWIDKNGKIKFNGLHNSGWFYNDENYFYGIQEINNLQGLVRDDGKTIISSSYKKITFDNKSKTVIAQNNEGKFGVIDLTGKIIIPFDYDSFNGFNEGLYLFKKNNLFGFVNSKGEIKIPFEFEEAYPFVNGLTFVKKGSFYNFINKNGDELTFYGDREDVLEREEQCYSKLYSSEIDFNIPLSKPDNYNTFVLIIGNENYMEQSIPQLTFANRDAEIVYEYINQTLGVPEKNIRFRKDATLSQLNSDVNWLSKIADSYGKDASIIIYYAGHGLPNQVTSTSYILPADGIASNNDTLFPLENIYTTLGDRDIKGCFVFLDACFSGITRDGKSITNSRGIKIKNKEINNPNLYVLTASQSDEAAFPYISKGHGMFTYFLLDVWNKTNGCATISEIADYVIENTRKSSIIENGITQTPTVFIGSGINPLSTLKMVK